MGSGVGESETDAMSRAGVGGGCVDVCVDENSS